MPDALQQHLTQEAADDRQRLDAATRAAREAEQYHEQAAQGAPPNAQAIREGNAMRVIELGEAYSDLIREGAVSGDTVVFQSNGSNVTANDLVRIRARYAHPELSSNMPFDFSDITGHNGEIAKQLQEIRAKNPENANVDVAVRASSDAVEHLSSADHVSPTAWKDAENYKQVESGGQIGRMSATGKNVVNEKVNGLSAERYERRNALAHEYLNASEAADRPASEVVRNLQNSEAHLTEENYRTALLGQRGEPQIAEITSEWMNTSSNNRIGTQSSANRAIVVSEIARMAKNGGSVQDIQDVSDAAQMSKMSPAETEKYMATRFPDGLSDATKASLKRLDEAARQADPEGRKPATKAFSDIAEKADIASGRLAANPEIKAAHALEADLVTQSSDVRNATAFIKDDVARRGYNAEQIGRVQKEIGGGIGEMTRTGGARPEEMAKLSPETREVLSGLNEGLKNNDRILSKIPANSRRRIAASASLLDADAKEAAAGATGHALAEPHNAPEAGNEHAGGHAFEVHETISVPSRKGTVIPMPSRHSSDSQPVASVASNRPSGRPALALEPHMSPAPKTPPGKLFLVPPREPLPPPGPWEVASKSMGGIQAGMSVWSAYNHLEGIQEHGVNMKDGAGLGMDAAGGLTAAAALGLLGEGALRFGERAALPVMVAQGIYDVSTCSPEERGWAAGRDVTAAGAGMFAGGMVAAAGGTMAMSAVASGGVSIAVVAGFYALEKESNLDDLRAQHARNMDAIGGPDNAGNSHLNDVADRLLEKAKTANAYAAFADSLNLASGPDGKIDFHNQENLQKVKEHLPAEDQRELSAKPPAERQRALEAFTFNLETSREDRTRLNFILDANGKVDLDNKDNQKMLLDAMEKDRADTQKTIAGMNDYVVFAPAALQDLDKRKLEFKQIEYNKALDAAESELSHKQWGSLPGVKPQVTTEQQAGDIARLKAGGDPEKVAQFSYTIQRDASGHIAGDPVPARHGEETIPADVMKAYLANPKAYKEGVPQVLYEYDRNGQLMLDDKGKPIADKLVIWNISDPDLNLSAAVDPDEKTRRLAAMANLPAGHRFDYQQVSAASMPAAIIGAGQDKGQAQSRPV